MKPHQNLLWFLLASLLLTGLLDWLPRATVQAASSVDQRIYLPLIATDQALLPPADKNDIPVYINYLRSLAGSPPVSFDATLNNNCYLHARYMAEENHLTHDERTDSPWYTPQGQICAQSGNAWLGGEIHIPYWQPYHAIEGWMSSVGHRLWLLYPTTPTFGFGFYTASNNRAGAGLDVLSTFNSGADPGYSGWPVRYPAAGQSGVPAAIYPITLNWRYFGPSPVVSATSLRVVGGAELAHSSTTSLSANHKGVQILPAGSLPANTLIEVTISGSYDGLAFQSQWRFQTGE